MGAFDGCFEVLGQSAAAVEPGDGAFDDPTLGQDDEPMGVAALDDLRGPGSGVGDRLGGFRPLISGVGEDALDERKGAARLPQNLAQTIAILNVGGVDDDAQQQAERVDQDVALAARDLLAGVIALRIDRGPPFCAALALWLSSTAAVGLASWPACSRTAT